MEAFFVIWIMFGLIGAAIGSGKKLGCVGFVLGVLLGPIGIVVVAVMKGSKLDQIDARPAEAGWFRDPTGRFDRRYFDGRSWTKHVTRDGEQAQFEDII